MFVPLILIISIAIAFLRGGRLKNLAQVQPRVLPLFFAPLVLQLVAFSPIGEMTLFDAPLARPLYPVSLGAAALALWFNRQLPGVFWIALGLFLNFLVIGLNGGFMPVSPWAREIAGLPPLTGRNMNVMPMSEANLLPWLTDVLPLPRFIPFANVFSIGDVLIALGGVIFIQRALTLRRIELPQWRARPKAPKNGPK